jgi:hypothetical protein
MRFPTRSRSHRPVLCAGIALVLAVLLAPTTVWADGGKPADSSSPGFSLPSKSPGTTLSEETGWSWTKMFKPFSFVQGNRRNMVQLATVGMCIALYIIWWRKLSERVGE